MNLSCVELSFSLKHCRYFIFLGPILFIKNFQVIDLFIYIVLYIYVRVCVCVCISRLTESLKILLSRRWYCHVERCKSLWDTHEEARKLPRCRGKGGQPAQNKECIQRHKCVAGPIVVMRLEVVLYETGVCRVREIDPGVDTGQTFGRKILKRIFAVRQEMRI